MLINKINLYTGLLLAIVLLALGGCTGGGGGTNDDDNNNPGNGWATTGSPFGGEVVGFSADATARALGEVWAAGRLGNVFYSSDYGSSWTRRITGLPERCQIQCMGGFYGPPDPVLIGVVAEDSSLSGVYYWSDTNASWYKGTGLPTANVAFRTIYFLNVTTAYVAVNITNTPANSRVYFSTDSGQSWSVLGDQTIGMTPGTISDFVAVTTSEFYIFNSNGLYTSSTGNSWTLYGTPTLTGNRLAFNTSIKLMGRNNGVYRYDAGTWNEVDTTVSPIIAWMSLVTTGTSEIFLGQNNREGLIYSNSVGTGTTNTYTTRNSITTPAEANADNSLQVTALQALFVAGGNHVVYRGSPIYGVLYSNNNGGSFVRRNTGITNTTVNSLLVDPNNSANLIAGTSSGVFRSDDSGATWTHILINDSSQSYYRQNCYVSTRDTNFQYFFVGTNNGDGGGALYTYDRSTGTWTLEKDDFTSPVIAVASLSNTSLTTSSLVLATQASDGTHQVWHGSKSTTWTWTGLGNPSATCLAASRYSTTAGSSIIYAGTLGGLRQYDNGPTWTLQSNNISTNAVQAIAVSNITNTTTSQVFVGFANDGMYGRQNATSGNVWTVLNTDLTTTGSKQIFAINLINPDNLVAGAFQLYIATNDKAWYSSNSGTDWEIRQTNLSKSAVRAIAASLTNVDTVYMATYNGHVYWSTSGGK